MQSPCAVWTFAGIGVGATHERNPHRAGVWHVHQGDWDFFARNKLALFLLFHEAVTCVH
jgi:hypothetical protein